MEWSGSEVQASRELVFSIPSNPYDRAFEKIDIKLGDIVQFFYDKKRIFIGVVITREKNAEIGTANYMAKDFMHYLLRSTTSHSFKNMTAAQITRKLCKEAGIPVGTLPKSKFKIKKIFVQEETIYDTIIRAYRKTMFKTKKKYMPFMNGNKLNITEKGRSCGVSLEKNEDIYAGNYTDTTENMVNLVKIYNDRAKQLGRIRNKTDMKKYGTYQAAYTKEDGVNAKIAAQNMIKGISKNASISAVGNVNCVAGKAVQIHDSAIGMYGWFYISNDKHIFENGVHTMDLEISWVNRMERGD